MMVYIKYHCHLLASLTPLKWTENVVCNDNILDYNINQRLVVIEEQAFATQETLTTVTVLCSVSRANHVHRVNGRCRMS